MEMRGVLAVATLLCLSVKDAVGGGCTNLQGNELEKSRLQQLKANILAQIGPIEPINENRPQLTAEEEKELNDTKAIYEKIKDQIAQPKCLSEDFYAKPVNTFTGAITSTEIETNEMDLSSELFEGALLKKYRINFQHLELPTDQNSISAADLLLFQSETDTLRQPVSDETQEVHIRVIINGVRYFVDKKSLNVYTEGPHIFNVSRAIMEAINKGARGPIVFDVLVTCSSSHECNRPMPYGSDSNLMIPASVEFDSGHSNSSQEPRIVLVSKNPKDVRHWSSRKRRSASAESDNFCNTEGQVTCCLHPFNISFGRDLGLYNVHLPHNFSANYCKGLCHTLTTAGSADRNTFLEELRKNPNISIEPCCSGLEYKPLTILLQIYNPATRTNHFMIDHLDQVTVTKCTCA